MERDYKELYEALQKEFGQYKEESIKWSIQDFIEMEDDFDITEARAQEALEDMVGSHDAEFGITWQHVEHYKSIYGTLKTN